VKDSDYPRLCGLYEEDRTDSPVFERRGHSAEVQRARPPQCHPGANPRIAIGPHCEA